MNDKKALYRVLSEEILARIRAQDFTYDQPICTERQLMEKHGVSRITAQRAIDELVHAGVLYRVKGSGSFVVRADVAGVDRPAPRRIFALVLPHTVDMKGMIHIVQAMSRRLDEDGHCLSIYIGEQGDPRCRAILTRLAGMPVAGVAYYPIGGELPVEQLIPMAARGMRVVIMDKPTAVSLFAGVVSENERGGMLAAEHLIGLGHRRIAFLATEALRAAPTLADRLVGLCKGLHAAGLTMEPELLRAGLCRHGESPEVAQRALATEISRLYDAGATAIFCQNDIIAFYASNACRSLGIRVPEQMSLCGFDDSDYAQMADPQLTTIEQVDAELGQAVANLLLAEAPGRVVVPVRLIARKSTAAPRAT